MGTLRADEQHTLGKAAVTTPDLGLFLDRQCTLGNAIAVCLDTAFGERQPKWPGSDLVVHAAFI